MGIFHFTKLKIYEAATRVSRLHDNYIGHVFHYGQYINESVKTICQMYEYDAIYSSRTSVPDLPTPFYPSPNEMSVKDLGRLYVLKCPA